MEMQNILLMIFTGILAISILMQTLIFFGMFKVFRELVDRFNHISKDLVKNVEVVSARAEETLTTIRDIGNDFEPVKDKIVDAVEIIHERVVRSDQFLEETTNTARVEVDRMKARIESATNRVEEMMELIQNTVLVPVNEITALTRGIRAGFDLIFRRRRKPPESSHQDEEMFI